MTTKTQIKKEPEIKTLQFSVLIHADKDKPGYHSSAPSLKDLALCKQSIIVREGHGEEQHVTV